MEKTKNTEKTVKKIKSREKGREKGREKSREKTKNTEEAVEEIKSREKSREKIVTLIKNNAFITQNEIVELTGLAVKGVGKDIRLLKKRGLIRTNWCRQRWLLENK